MNRSFFLIFITRFLIVCSFTIISCSKNPIEISIVDDFRSIYNSAGDKTSFLFFTDTHLNENNNIFDQYISCIYDYYDQLPLEFCLCGGDWLNNSDTNQQAYNKLQFIGDFTYGLFKENIYNILGNHDTNYQGKLDENSPKDTGLLSHDTLVNLLFHLQGNSYYTFRSNNARLFIFDTGIDWDFQMNKFRWEQVDWFAKHLETNIDENIIIALHIYSNDIDNPTDFSKHIMEIANAFNDKIDISINGNHYDFYDSIGKIACVLCGHCHTDFIKEEYSIPVIGTTHFKDGDVPTFDLCIFDWEQNILNLIRVGSGVDRIVRLKS